MIGLVTMICWELGTVEAILISILAGFSVDYTVHFTHVYSAHTSGDRSQRVLATLSEMGNPVLSGACTSIIASIPLMACEMAFFFKFGFFMCFTIFFSWLYANFGFLSLMATIGPEDVAREGEGTSREQGEEEHEMQRATNESVGGDMARTTEHDLERDLRIQGSNPELQGAEHRPRGTDVTSHMDHNFDISPICIHDDLGDLGLSNLGPVIVPLPQYSGLTPRSIE